MLMAAGWLAAQTPGASREDGGVVAGAAETLEGKPAAGLVISLLAAEPGLLISRNLTARTDDRGRFTIAGVPDGKYRVCVPFADNLILDPCLWGGFPVGVEVKEGKAAPAQLRVVVAEGAELTVQVADPGGALASVKETVQRRPALDVRVCRPGTPLLAMRLASDAGSAREYRLTVPVETSLTVTVASQDLVLAEPTGERAEFTVYGSGLKAEIKLSRESKKKDLRVQVGGKR